MRSHFRSFLMGSLCVAAVLAGRGAALAQTAPFDLAGPSLDVKVTHAGASLPISEAPNLAVGDQVRIRADLPPSQSVHYLLVVAFLRGATNPPPDSWFYRAETWNHKGRDGLTLTVPQGAQQVIVFLAPETGGDFKTLVDAVRGRPGAFVRASQDLNQLSLDRTRLDAFLAAVRRSNQSDPADLKTVSPLLARSLAIKLDTDCLVKSPELQAPCLMQGQDALVLNDGHSASIVQALTSGNPADLITELSATPQAGFGYYSPYVAAVMDIARIMDSFHTAQYQYIPALPKISGDEISLVLNTPPSFHNPMSVLVTALPAVEPPQAPPLRPVDPKEAYCAVRPGLVLPVEGAPLVFSTRYAHDMVLRLKGKDDKALDLPVRADPERGGLLVDTKDVSPAELGPTVEATLHGQWGFQGFDGPSFKLENVGDSGWRLAEEDQSSLIVGRDDAVHIGGPGAACVAAVSLRDGSGDTSPVEWKPAQADQLALTLPLAKAQPGPVTLLLKRYGDKEPKAIALQAFDQPGRLDSFEFHVGDPSGLLKGARLDQVAGLTFRGVAFKPDALTSSGGADQLTLTAADPEAAAKLKSGEGGAAKVTLKDGRTVSLRASVQPLRPSVSLIAKSIEPPAAASPTTIQLANKDEVVQGGALTFSVRAQTPAAFSDHDKIEVATADGSATTTLAAGAGLTLEDAQVAVATLDTGKAFNTSAFGPLRFRIVDGDAAGDWRPLATLVRLPAIREIKCPPARDAACELTGSDLFLIDSLSPDPGFEHAVKVPEGFTGSSLQAPRSRTGRIYLKLHDDPAAVDAIDLTPHERVTAAAAAKAG